MKCGRLSGERGSNPYGLIEEGWFRASSLPGQIAVVTEITTVIAPLNEVDGVP